MFLHRLSFLLSVAAVCNAAVDIEKYLKVCNRNSPDVNDCLVDAVQAGIATMTTGIPDLDVQSLDPFFQKNLKFEYKNNQIQVKMVNKNVYVKGLQHSTVKDVRLRADEDNFHMEIDMYSPAIQITGDYQGSGSYNALQFVRAVGSYVTNMTDLVYTWKLDGKPETVDNEVFVRITAFEMRPDVSNMQVFMTNEAPETKDITDLGVRLVNENWRILYRELLPIAQNIWNKNGIKVANAIFLKVPYNRLFPN